MVGGKVERSMLGGSRPPWLVVRLPQAGAPGEKCRDVEGLLKKMSVNTVCHEAHCPNIGKCFSRGTATFMILGGICTRNCRFCAVASGAPLPPDPDEPRRVALSAKALGLTHVVVTSVTRDDLEDGGAGQFALTIQEIRALNPGVTVEVLVPDFKGSDSSLKTVLAARPEVLNHNVETVPELYRKVRPQADYERSLVLLRKSKEFSGLAGGVYTKSGLMLGFGEEREAVIRVMRDLRDVKVDFLTLGQYLRPSREHLSVVRYITPEEFDEYKAIGERMGFAGIQSGPLVRSSFEAESMIRPATFGEAACASKP